jgi:exoribonuclease R
MPRRHIRVTGAPEAPLRAALTALRTELGVPESFPPQVEAEAERAAKAPVPPPYDATDIPFFTVDPPTSRDLDQAMHLSRHGSRGYRVHYAIADVAAFVAPGDAVDIEAHKRGETLYGADSRIPLHPKVLSEGAASLLQDQLRPALLWSIDLDETGEGIKVDVRRARVKSRARLDYGSVQAAIDKGGADPMWTVLREIGELRMKREAARGGISLPLPEQEVAVDADGKWTLAFRARHPLEDWNEQISLLTGMAAAHLMVEHKVGILRTLPEPEAWAIQRLHRTARALGIAWPDGLDYPAFIRSLDPTQPVHIAMMVASTTVLRGAGYVTFNGSVPANAEQSALASTYAHATAPLRRLVDRYSGEICVALCAGAPVPQWVLDGLPQLPEIMQQSGLRASRYEHAVLDLAEAAALASRIGETFPGSIVELDHEDPKQGTVIIRDPAIEARIGANAPLPLGADVTARLVEADPAKRVTRFELAS